MPPPAISILFGWQAFLMVQAPITLLAGGIGVWLFYVQHQFEHTYWARDAAWNSRDGALHGSSHYDLPPLLRWFTANIGLHHTSTISPAASPATGSTRR